MLNNNLKKNDLAKIISSKTGFSFNFSKKIVDDLINIIIDKIKDGSLKLKNIGTFRLINKNQRIGRNPITKEQFIISKRKSLSFVTSKKIKDYLEKL